MDDKYFHDGFLQRGKRGRVELGRPFYDLSRKAKVTLILQMESDGVFDDHEHLIYATANALLQHDNRTPIGIQYPAFMEYPENKIAFFAIRKLSKPAKDADALDAE